ncbi:MAG: dynamin family protein [Bacteroidales bacterium]|nr:dynamin family protein [Bacteroidales bacterium]
MSTTAQALPAFDALDPTRDCPLLSEGAAETAQELVGALNECARQLAELAHGRGRAALEREEGKKLLARYVRVRNLLQRPSYCVGFLGTSQAGKSTIFNRVLQDTIAVSGGGRATTALPSRLRRGADRRCTLAYMSTQQYRERLRQLCNEVAISDSNIPTEELIRIVHALQPTVAGIGDGQRAVRPEDIDYLKAFIAAYQNHRALVLEGKPQTKEIPFDQRSEYINHNYQGGTAHLAGLLLQEVQLTIPSEHLPPQLELCDLPGVGVSRSVDTIVTRDFVRSELDGALIFINVATSLDTAEVKDLVRLLSAYCGNDLSGRVWLVANRCDSLSEPNYRPAPGQSSIFEALIEFVGDSQIDPSHICFTSNTLFEYAQHTNGALSEADAARYMRLGTQPFPDTLPDSLKHAWAELLHDGGVRHLRKLVTHEIAASVATQIRNAARRELASLRQDVAHLVKSVTATVAPTTRRNAVLCQNAILRLRDGLIRQPEDFAALVQIRADLRTALAEQLCPDERHAATIRGMNAATLSKRFAVDALTLDEMLTQLLSTRTVDLVYQELADQLSGVDNVPIGTYASVLEAWDDFRRADRVDPQSWQIRVPTFRDHNPFANGHSFTGNDYLELMTEKVRTVVAQTIHGLRSQLRHRLGEIEGHLETLLLPENMA